MRKQTNSLMAMMILVVGLTVSAQAQSGAQHYVARIPFGFNVGDAKLPAGEYAVSCINPASDRSVLQFRQLDGSVSAMLQTRPVTGKAGGNVRLIFHRYGESYFFTQVWGWEGSDGLEAVKTSAERTRERETAGIRYQTATVAMVSPR